MRLEWTAPGGTCSVTGYGIYRGTLPITSSSDYDHLYLICNHNNTTYDTSIGYENYYYLVVPSNDTT